MPSNAENPASPDAPHAPGTPELDDLDAEVDPTPGGTEEGEDRAPASQDVRDDAGAVEPSD